jgi:hypothetical protein
VPKVLGELRTFWAPDSFIVTFKVLEKLKFCFLLTKISYVHAAGDK